MSCYGLQISTFTLSLGTFTRMCPFLPVILSPAICRWPYVACQDLEKEFNILLQCQVSILSNKRKWIYEETLCFVRQLHLWFLETENAHIIVWNFNHRESKDTQPSTWNHSSSGIWCEHQSGKFIRPAISRIQTNKPYLQEACRSKATHAPPLSSHSPSTDDFTRGLGPHLCTDKTSKCSASKSIWLFTLVWFQHIIRKAHLVVALESLGAPQGLKEAR